MERPAFRLAFPTGLKVVIGTEFLGATIDRKKDSMQFEWWLGYLLGDHACEEYDLAKEDLQKGANERLAATSLGIAND